MEAKYTAITNLSIEESVKLVIVKVLKVYANPKIISTKNHINPNKWSPLIYNFRHYYTLGDELGKSYRSET